jgi:Complex 1 protein (LYR family)
MSNPALSLYRHFLRVARKMPSAHRQHFITKAARAGFEKNRSLSDDAKVARELVLGEVLLHQARSQADHLTACKEAGLLDRELVDTPHAR